MENATTHNIPTTTVTHYPITEPTASSSASKQSQHSTSSPYSTRSNPSASHSRSPSRSQLVDGEQPQSESSMELRKSKRLQRPALPSRKSSGSIIIPRESKIVEIKHEEYDPDDARAMSPRRTSDEIDRMGDDAREALEQQAHALQSNLLEILERVDSVKSEHEKLEGGNKFLQSYIGELMQTSKITSSGAHKPKKGRGNK